MKGRVLCFLFVSLFGTPAFAQSWRHSDVGNAWADGYKGKGTTVTLIDFFGGQKTWLRLHETPRHYTHGEAMGTIIKRIGSETKLIQVQHDLYANSPIYLGSGTNIVNVSWGISARAGRDPLTVPLGLQAVSSINYAANGSALIIKSAGNESKVINQPDEAGMVDFVSGALKPYNAIYAGALNKNGTEKSKAEKSALSNYPGWDARYQSRFLFVGVNADIMGADLATSGAAAIISGYAAVLGSKFKRATPTEIGNKLLATARTDTIKNYSAAVYGRGEASLSNALAPRILK